MVVPSIYTLVFTPLHLNLPMGTHCALIPIMRANSISLIGTGEDGINRSEGITVVSDRYNPNDFDPQSRKAA